MGYAIIIAQAVLVGVGVFFLLDSRRFKRVLNSRIVSCLEKNKIRAMRRFEIILGVGSFTLTVGLFVLFTLMGAGR